MLHPCCVRIIMQNNSLLTSSVHPDDGRFKRQKHVFVSYTLLSCDIVVLIDWIYVYIYIYICIYTIVLHF